MDLIKLGYAPTRRSIFSAPDAVKYRNLTADRLTELNVDYCDITDCSEDGLLHDEASVAQVSEKFRREKVDGIFVPHCNFGTEYAVASLAKELGVPVLVWGPRDEAPLENGSRLRDSQCGLFATGKVLRRFRVPFTYMTNCRLSDPEFERGVRDFLAVCNVVKAFKNTKVLQISTRPYDFLSTMCNEGELLERFNIRLAPIPMPELIEEVKRLKDTPETKAVLRHIEETMTLQMSGEKLENVAALKVAMQTLAKKYGCNAIAIQCWNALQGEIGIMPCCANALLTDEGIPVVCETDIHGAITSIMMQAANLGTSPTFFADWTVRHPSNDNGELLQHCGPWPLSLAKTKPVLGTSVAFTCPGSVSAELKHGDLTLARFDGDNGEYSMLLGTAKAIEGPYTKGTYVWVEVENLKKLEHKLVTGPYIHHCTGVHGDIVPVLYEACKYLGLKPDLYDDNEEKVQAYLRGE